mgnify:CR=1 FL=1
MSAEKLLMSILGIPHVIHVCDYMTFEDLHDFPLISVDVGIWDTVVCGDDSV